MKNRLYLIAGIFILFIIIASIYSLIPRSEIVLQVAPEEFTLIIDNKNTVNAKNGDIISVSPGKHSLVIKRNEFKSETISISVKNHQKKSVVIVLTAQTEAAKKLLKNDKSSYVIEKYTGINMEKQIQETIENNPITKILPIEAHSYSVKSCRSQLYPDDLNKIALCARIESEDYKQIVKNYIQSKGYNPDTFEYIWDIYL